MPNQPSTLGPGTLEALKSLAQAKTGEAKRSLFAQMSHLAFGSNSVMAPGERAATADILLGLLSYAAPEARGELARLISAGQELPPQLLRALAFDDFSIAQPILERCAELSDDDIIELLREGSDAHRVAITGRAGLSERVSSEIVALDDIELIERLAANKSARIDAATFGEMATKSQASPLLCKLMLSRADVPSIVAHRMFWWVKGPLRKQILSRHLTELQDLEETLEDAFRSGLARRPEAGGLRRFLDFVAAQDYVPVCGLIDVLREGSLGRFAEALGERLGIDADTARRIVRDTGGEAIAMACRAMRAEKGQFINIFFLTDYLRFGKARPLSDLKHVETIYDIVSQSRAKASVALWACINQAEQACASPEAFDSN